MVSDAGAGAGAVAPAAASAAAARAAPAPAFEPWWVELRGVTKRYGARVAVDGVSLAVARGEFFTILGPSGCGKSTLLKLVNGIEVPDEGRVLVAGEDVTGRPPYRRPVHTVFQDYALFPHLDVRGNVEFALRIQGVRRSERRARVREVLDFMGLTAAERKRVDNLSGGERQRVALARAVVDRPEVLLLDEPLSAMDLKLRRQMAEFVLDLRDRFRLTILYVTHDQEEAFELSNRIAVQRDGRILQIGAPREIYDRPATEFVAGFLGEVNLFRGEPFEALCGRRIRPAAAGSGAGSGAGAGGFRTLGVRPEHVFIGRQRDGGWDMALRGRVTKARFAGSQSAYVVLLDEPARCEVRVVRPSHEGPPFEPGDEVAVGWSQLAEIHLAE